MNRNCRLISILGLLVTVAQFVRMASATDIRTVAVSGDTAHIDLPAVTFGFLGSPSINERGETSFASWLIDQNGGASYESIWTESGGAGLRLVARRGTPLSDVAGFAFDSFYGDRVGFPASIQYGVPVSNNHGVVTFRGTALEIGSYYNSFMGIWRERYGELRTLNSNGNIATWEAPLINEAGDVVFGTSVYSSSNGVALYQFTDNHQLRLVVPSGVSPMPGGSPGDLYSIYEDDSVFTPPRYVLNDAGQISFMAATNRASGIFLGNSGLWIEQAPGDIRAVAIPGNIAVGTTGAVWLGVTGNGINNEGKVAFTAFVREAGINTSGVWTGHDSGDLVPLAQQGQPAPGASPGSTFGFFEYGGVVINDTGHVAFRATLNSPTATGQGLWIADVTGSVIPIALPGMAAPGTNAVFRGTEAPVLNARGQIAFIGYLSGPGVHSSNDTGIWATDNDGVLRLIARTGDSMDIDDGPGVNIQTIYNLWFAGASGNEDGRASGFNNLGQLAFMARTTSFQSLSYGIFVSNAVGIPEPSALYLLATGIVPQFFSSRLRTRRSCVPIIWTIRTCLFGRPNCFGRVDRAHLANCVRTNPYMASAVKRAYGFCPTSVRHGICACPF